MKLAKIFLSCHDFAFVALIKDDQLFINNVCSFIGNAYGSFQHESMISSKTLAS